MLSGQINFPALSSIHDEGHFLMFNWHFQGEPTNYI